MGKNYDVIRLEYGKLLNWKHGFKSSRSLLFSKEVFLKFCRIHMKTPETCTSNKKNSIAGAFLWILRNFLEPFFTEHLPRLLLVFFHSLSCFFATRLTNRNQVFSIFEHVLSRLSNVMNIMNFAFTLLCETDDPVVAAGKQLLLQAFLWDTRN